LVIPNNTHPCLDIRVSLIGCTVWAVVLVAWILFFQLGWRKIPFLAALNMVNVEGMAWQ